MRAVVLLFACLTFVGHARRVRAEGEEGGKQGAHGPGPIGPPERYKALIKAKLSLMKIDLGIHYPEQHDIWKNRDA